MRSCNPVKVQAPSGDEFDAKSVRQPAHACDVTAPEIRKIHAVDPTTLIVVLVNGSKKKVADRVGDVEVIAGHKAPVVMTNVMPSQAIQER